MDVEILVLGSRRLNKFRAFYRARMKWESYEGVDSKKSVTLNKNRVLPSCSIVLPKASEIA
jgi:hypothetical protein